MKHLSKLLVFILLLNLLVSVNVQAKEQAGTEKIVFSDGSYILSEITVIQSRAASVRKADRYYDYYNAKDVRQWRATLTGTFTYDGTTSSCTAVSTNFTVYASGWTLDSVSEHKIGNQAIGDFYISYSPLPGDYFETSVRVQLTCDKNGNLS